MQDMNLSINLPGSIPRLPLHTGALMAYHDLGFPRPDEILASSAGAMAGSAIIGWNYEEFKEALFVIGNLTPDQIFSFRRKLKVKLAALGITTMGLGALVMLDHKISKGKKVALGITGITSLLATDAIVGNELIHSESHLSPLPLKNLLHDSLNFNSIFNSPIRLGVIVTDMKKPDEVIFYNHNPKNSDPRNPEHRERWVKILLASSRLPGKFPHVEVDGIDTIDGEVWTDFPVRQMKNFVKSIRFDYWPPLGSEETSREWISVTSRSFDIMRDRCTSKKIEHYDFERQSNPRLPEFYYVRLSQRLVNVLPKIKLHNFASNDMRVLQNIGYESVMEQKDEIRQYLEK